MLTQAQIDTAVADVVPNILRGLKESLQESAQRAAEQAAIEMVKKEVQAWASTTLVPAIRESLAASKDGLISIVPALTAQMVNELQAQLARELKANLEQSWTRKKIFEALFE